MGHAPAYPPPITRPPLLADLLQRRPRRGVPAIPTIPTGVENARIGWRRAISPGTRRSLRQVADVAVHDPEQRDDRRLVRRDRIQIAYGLLLRGSANRAEDSAKVRAVA
jgi:hypothetical protein